MNSPSNLVKAQLKLVTPKSAIILATSGVKIMLATAWVWGACMVFSQSYSQRPVAKVEYSQPTINQVLTESDVEVSDE